MSVIRVCFLGTPPFAATHLQSILQNDQFKIVGVVTQPDRPAGRKMQLTASAVKTLAQQFDLPVLTPENLRKEPEQFEIIQSWKADVAVVVAFGQILSTEFMNSFPYGAVNVHGSLLPKWRGAAPIQRSLQAGDTETGVSLQKMVFKLDAGAVIGERKIQLDEKINATELYEKLSYLGCELLNVELVDYVHGKINPKEQDESQVTIAPKIDKLESQFNFKDTAKDLHNKVRAFSMGPGTFFVFQEKRFKVHQTEYINENSSYPAGSISEVGEKYFSIQTSAGQLKVIQIQPESKPKMSVQDFLKSNPFKKGDVLV